MLLLSPILSASLESNIVNAARTFIRSLNVSVSTTGIKEKLEEHPDYPSLLSVSDALTNWNISNISFRAERAMLEKLPTPYLVQIKDGRDLYFVVVKAADPNGLVLSDKNSQKWRTVDWDSFLANWTGTVTVAEPEENAGEMQYAQARKKELLRKSSYLFAAGLVLLIVAYTIGAAIFNTGRTAWPGVSMLLLKVFGTYVGSLLLWYEIDRNNVAIKKVCKAGKKTNCNAILQSKASRLFGLISWSEIGFVYFIGGLAFLVSNSLSQSTVSLISFFSLLASPYILFSLFYQWRIAKQWCLLCVTVQILLMIEVLTGFVGNTFSINMLSEIELSTLITLPMYFLLPLVLWLLIKPALHAARENSQSKLALTRLKHNNQIFESQLVRRKTVINESKQLGITLGDPNARNKIIKVCNPYCGPCAKAHPEIHQLMQRMPDLQIQIIFTASGNDEDTKAPPVRHFLAVQEEYNENVLDEALSTWYSSTGKDYESFAVKYPVVGPLDKYNRELDTMVEWCNANDISHTPTFFVNGHELPDMYDIPDLKHLLT